MIEVEQAGPLIAPQEQTIRVRLETLIRIRWFAILGQMVTVLFVAYYLKFEFLLSLCVAVIACSVWLNLFLRLRYQTSLRLSEPAAVSLLVFDIVQLAGLLYLTGGIHNPFSILIVVPVIISATTHSYRQSLLLGLLVVLITTLLTFYHEPLPWYPGETLELPNLYVGAVWMAIIAGMMFTAFDVYRVASESRSLAKALAATELILQREQYLTSLDGLASAAAHELGTPLATIALVAKEMERELPEGSAMREDAGLLRSQASRCRDILQKLTSMSDQGDEHIGKMSIASLMDEIAEPHRNFGIELNVNIDNNSEHNTDEPRFVRNPAILYGIGNLLENAVDFAVKRVDFDCYWDDEIVELMITDDGPGFRKEQLEKIGEPYVSSRSSKKKKSGGGLGLGLFIAKTLLERSGAELEFSSGYEPEISGAQVSVTWPRPKLQAQIDAFDARNETGSWQ